jgi:ADP-ribosylglycohydrolase
MSFAHQDSPLQRTQTSLEGLAMGDAFGKRFFSFSQDLYDHCLQERQLPATDTFWRFTDDTQMALSLINILRLHQQIDQDALIASFAAHYDPSRGYGAGMHQLLREIRTDQHPWRELVSRLFAGQGSYGNGAAMRVAPLGAFFAESIDTVIEQARLSAEVTHTHPEAIAGAITVATAAAFAWRARQLHQRPTRVEFIDLLLPFVPESEVRRKVCTARNLPATTSAQAAASVLGSGAQISAQDTVPYVIWCASQFLGQYEEALWQTASGRGDVDTTCAMVGGIVVLSTGIEQIPETWRTQREILPSWPFEEKGNTIVGPIG